MKVAIQAISPTLVGLGSPQPVVNLSSTGQGGIQVAAPKAFSLTVISGGAKGIPGANGANGTNGADGVSGARYVHYQQQASAEWRINHPMAAFPSVTLVDSAGDMILGDLKYESSGCVVVQFASAVAGTAYLN